MDQSQSTKKPIIQRPKVGVGVILFSQKDKTILLSRRKKENLLALPGGNLEMFEEIEDCARREWEEEVGIRPDK